MAEPPSTPRKTRQLTRDDRIEVQTLHSVGWTYLRISQHMDITLRQVQTAVKGSRTPKKRHGRPPLLDDNKKQQLIEFVTASAHNRQIPYAAIPHALEWNVSEYAIRRALRSEGFACRLARRKPPISPQNQQIRLAWAIEHINWTREQWDKVLWTDETWVTGGRHTRTWVTRRAGEELDATCIVEKFKRRRDGCFGDAFREV